MDITRRLDWQPLLLDPSGRRSQKPRTSGKTMVIDKGLGTHAFEDLLQTSSPYIDLIKIGFGTAPLYPHNVLQSKIRTAKANEISILPGGTFLEVAIHNNEINAYFNMIGYLGFNSIEVSDGTIEMSRSLRNEMILRGIECGLSVYTEYGKKCWGSLIETEKLIETIHEDLRFGAEFVTIEGRESGLGVGIYDDNGRCKQDDIQKVVQSIPNQRSIMWETPLKTQQVHLLTELGPDIHLGNIAPYDVLSLESLRRGLRSDTLLTARC